MGYEGLGLVVVVGYLVVAGVSGLVSGLGLGSGLGYSFDPVVELVLYL